MNKTISRFSIIRTTSTSKAFDNIWVITYATSRGDIIDQQYTVPLDMALQTGLGLVCPGRRDMAFTIRLGHFDGEAREGWR